MQLELPEANIANKNTKLKENESKKLIEKVTDLKLRKKIFKSKSNNLRNNCKESRTKFNHQAPQI